MMKKEYIKTDYTHDDIAIVTLNRPEKRNALNMELLEQFVDTIQGLNDKNVARAIIIKGEGPIFCSGLDLAEAQDPSITHHSTDLIARAFNCIYRSPHVTIAAVHGTAIAGGAGLMLACDLAIAAEGTQFGFPETQKGLVAALALTFLARQLRERDIRELLLVGDLIDTEKALSIGMINAVAPPANLIDEALNIAKKAKRGAPHAIAQTKELIDTIYGLNYEQALEETLEYHEKNRRSGEAEEGILSFLENRLPAWFKDDD